MRLARWLVLFAVLASTWTAISVAGQTVSDLLLLTAATVVVLSMMSEHPRYRATPSGPDLRFLLVAAWFVAFAAVVSAFNASSPSHELSIAFGLTASLTVVPLVIAWVIRDERQGRHVLEFLLASAAINGLLELLYFRNILKFSPKQLTWNPYLPTATSRAVGLTGHPNVVGYISAVVIPLIPGLLTTSHRRHRFLIGVLGVLALCGLLLSGSRGGALGAAVGLIYLSLRSRNRRVRRLVFGSLLLGGVIVIAVPGNSLVQRLLGGEDAGASNDSRILGLSEAVASLKRTFPGGTGLENIYTVHSGLLALMVGGGLLAIVGLFVWLRGIRRVFTIAMTAGPASSRQLATACTASGVGALTFLATSPIIYHRYALVPVGVGLALAFRLQQPQPPGGIAVEADIVTSQRRQRQLNPSES